jgi:two-component system OmpR family sensor kinase/two-component system phosphate regulon sensor histidine kinase PhoR
MIYDVPRDEIEGTLSYLRYGIFGAILTSVLLAAAASLFLARQLTRPLSETRDAAIRVASGDYAAEVPVKGGTSSASSPGPSTTWPRR